MFNLTYMMAVEVIAERSDNSFVKHPDGGALQKALLTGIYEGDYYPEMTGKRVSQSWIAKKLGVSTAAISYAKKRLMKQQLIEPNKVVEKERERVQTEIILRSKRDKAMLDELPEINAQLSAYILMNIKDSIDLIHEIERDPEKRNDPYWVKIKLDAIKERRASVKDAMNLFFGLIDDKAKDGLIVQMQEKVERITEFFNCFAPELLSVFVEWLDGKKICGDD